MPDIQPWHRAIGLLAVVFTMDGCAAAIVSATISQRTAAKSLSAHLSSSAPKAASSPLPSPTATARSTPTAVASSAARSVETTALRGKAYYSDGRPVFAGSVSVLSLDKARPALRFGLLADGAWVVDDVPVGVRLDVMVMDGGGSEARRGVVLTPASYDGGYSMNFGGPVDPADPEGHRHPLKKREAHAPTGSGSQPT